MMPRSLAAAVAALVLAAGVAGTAEDTYLLQSRGKNYPADIDEWRKGEQRGGLKPYPPAPPGTPNPPDPLFHYGGSGTTSFAGPDLGLPFAQWMAKMEAQRPAIDKAA